MAAAGARPQATLAETLFDTLFAADEAGPPSTAAASPSQNTDDDLAMHVHRRMLAHRNKMQQGCQRRRSTSREV